MQASSRQRHSSARPVGSPSRRIGGLALRVELPAGRETPASNQGRRAVPSAGRDGREHREYSRECPRRAVRSRSAGFTLLEMMFVVSIIAVMTAVSVPSILNAMAHAKLRGASSSLSGLIQSSRMQAVKGNKTLTVRFVTTGGVPFAVAKDAQDTSSDLKSTDAQVQLGSSTFRVVVPATGEAPLLTDAVLSYTPLNLPDLISLSPRGLPCKYVSGVCTPAGFVYYIVDTSQKNAWAAVSISPGGRVKQWFWNGKTWTD